MSSFFIMVEIVDCDKDGSKCLATAVCFSPLLIALTSLYFSSKVRTHLFFVSCFLDFVDCDVEAVELETAPLSRVAIPRLAIGTLVTALSEKNQIQQGCKSTWLFTSQNSLTQCMCCNLTKLVKSDAISSLA